MQLYRGILTSATDPSADVVFADSTDDLLVLRLRGGSRETALGNHHVFASSTLARPDYVLTDEHGTTLHARQTNDFGSILPGTVDVVIPISDALVLTDVLTLSAEAEPITIKFSLQPL
ncbi:hypothetical protein [Humibacter albus]|uniref:hypothetical protein n=1 Tax=Humibacter albus TaxID=427754 RepID=UPI0003B3BD62|nr:hypothetical protein [Humibacter albus]